MPSESLLDGKFRNHLAENLQKNGYKTAYIGKWHLGDEAWYPEKQGYDENFGGCDYGQPPSFFDPYNNPKHRHPTIRAGIHKLPGRKQGEYLTHREADEAVKLIRQMEGSAILHSGIPLCGAYTHPGNSGSCGQIQIQGRHVRNKP